MYQLFAERTLLTSGWASDVLLTVTEDGLIERIEPGARPGTATRLGGPVLPGMVNLHSHAFQRLIAGLTDVASDRPDSFWTWRERMYRLVETLTPAQLESVSRYLYVEMLKAGYTTVAEFHYLHHAPGGAPFATRSEMSQHLMAAAAETGIGLCMLPVFYAHGGFGGQPPTPGQQRFIHDVDGYLALWAEVEDQIRAQANTSIGLAFHSLRAATPEQIEVVTGALGGTVPIHIHIAEQTREVDDCRAWCGQRPVEALLDRAAVDERWCLVHATHIDEGELGRIAASGAVVGLCPTTEANLGDGIFPAAAFLQQGGHFGIGSDSHASVSVVEELRWLEYGQRLASQRRNRLATPTTPQVGTTLYTHAARGGAQVTGQPVGAIAPGRRADLVVLDGDHPLLAGCTDEHLLSRWLFGGGDAMVRDVFVAGRPAVTDGHHPQEAQAGRDFAATAKAVLGAL